MKLPKLGNGSKRTRIFGAPALELDVITTMLLHLIYNVI